MPETKTDLIVQAKARGFQDVQQQANKLVTQAQKAQSEQAKGWAKNETASKGYRKELVAVTDQLKKLLDKQLALTKAMSGMQRGTEQYKQLKSELKGINKEYERSESLQRRMVNASRTGEGAAKEQRRGSFMQGLVQGGTGIDYLQRGPGMYRQAAGYALGNMARGAAGAPFGGVSGLSQAISTIPGFGGFLSGQFNNAIGFAGGALELQRTRLGALPFLSGSGGWGQQSNIRGIQSGTNLSNLRRDFSREQTEYYRAMVPGMKKDFEGMPEGGLPKWWKSAQDNAMVASRNNPQVTYQQALDVSINEAIKGRVRKDTDAVVARVSQGRQPDKAKGGTDLFAGIRRYGQTLGGLSEQAAIPALMPMLQRGGGNLAQAERQDMVRMAFAAQTRYGIGADVSGAFLGAGRRGGMVGGGGAKGEARAIGDALRLGLQGSELTDYMQQMAQGFDQWKTTGIPINSGSIARMGTVFSGLGLGGLRGAALGQQMGAASQRLTQTGPQDAIDLLMLQNIGGYQGGGMNAYVEAMKQMESFGEGGLNTPGAMKLIRQLFKAGGGAGGAGINVVHEALNRKGMNISWAETERLTGGINNGMTDAELASSAQFLGTQTREKTGGRKGIYAGAEEYIRGSGGVGRAAGLENQQNVIGREMMPTMFNLQQSALKVNKAFADIAGKPMEELSKGFVRFTDKLVAFAENPVWDNWAALVAGKF